MVDALGVEPSTACLSGMNPSYRLRDVYDLRGRTPTDIPRHLDGRFPRVPELLKLLAEIDGHGRTRTCDLRLNRTALHHFSFVPKNRFAEVGVEPT